MRILLLSGGLDSALCLAKYGADLCLGFNYGQDHAIELEYAEKIAEHYKTKFVVRDLHNMPKVDDVNFAGRNAVFLANAAAICQQDGGGEVVIGCNFTDAQRFPDCRPPFIRSLNNAYKEAYGVSVHAPLLTMTKAMIVMECKELQVPQTWTCYKPKDGAPCGECYACKGLTCNS